MQCKLLINSSPNKEKLCLCRRSLCFVLRIRKSSQIILPNTNIKYIHIPTPYQIQISKIIMFIAIRPNTNKEHIRYLKIEYSYSNIWNVMPNIQIFKFIHIKTHRRRKISIFKESLSNVLKMKSVWFDLSTIIFKVLTSPSNP